MEWFYSDWTTRLGIFPASVTIQQPLLIPREKVNDDKSRGRKTPLHGMKSWEKGIRWGQILKTSFGWGNSYDKHNRTQIIWGMKITYVVDAAKHRQLSKQLVVYLR